VTAVASKTRAICGAEPFDDLHCASAGISDAAWFAGQSDAQNKAIVMVKLRTALQLHRSTLR